MLTLPPSTKLYACTTPVDMRKSFDGLAGAVEAALGQDPMSGHVFCFFSKRANHIRLLWWDRDGWLMLAKRLERGRFRPPWFGQGQAPVVWEMEPGDLTLVMQGIDVRGAKRLPRWRPEPPKTDVPIM